MSDLSRELDAIRTATAITRPASTYVLRLSGEGARDTARFVLPSRLHLRDAQARQSLLIDESGTPIADVLVCGDDESYLLLVDAPADPRSHLRANLRGECALDDLGIEYDVIDVHGPWAWELVSAVLGSDFLALPYLNFFRIDEGYCLRAGKTGEYGYHLVVKKSESERIYASFLKSGAEFDLCEVSAGAISHAGFENWFFDAAYVPRGATPIELQLQWRLASDRDWLGRAAIEARRVCAPRITACVLSDRELSPGDPITLGTRGIGEITRAAYSSARGEFFASALLDRELAHGGIDRFEVRGARVRTAAPPLLDNRSLYVDPRRHSYRTRDEIAFGSLARPNGAAMEQKA
jgi:glycine cleavage system aminomethyltransferase T